MTEPPDPRASDATTSHRTAWEALARLDVDAIIDELCHGRPIDVVGRSDAHVDDAAYFIEDGRVAARAIATLAAATGRAGTDLAILAETIVEECTADIVEEGPVRDDPELLREDPTDEDPPLAVRLSQRLGVSIERALEVIPLLNGLPYDVRHVAHRCLSTGLSVAEYAEAYGEDRRDVATMLERVQRLALGR